MGFSLLVWMLAKLSKTYEDKLDVALLGKTKSKTTQQVGKAVVLVRASGFTFLKNKFYDYSYETEAAWLAASQNQDSNVLQAEFKNRLEVALPKSILLLDVEQLELTSSESAINSKKVPVILEEANSALRGYVFTQTPVFAPDSVRVYGPEEVLEQIQFLSPEKLDVLAFANRKTQNVKLKVSNLPKGIDLETDKVSITAEAKKLVLEKKKVALQVEHAPENKKWILLTDSVEIRVVSDLETLLRHKNTPWVAKVDFEAASGDQLAVKLQSVPEGKTRVFPDKINFLIFEQKLPQ